MKILLTNDFFEDYGGAGVMFHQTVKLLESRGHQVFPFLAVENPISSLLFSHYSFFVKPKSRLGLFLLKFFNYSLFKSFRSFIKKTNPDIIHCHQNYTSPLSFLLAAKLEHVPVVQTIHDFGLSCITLKINNKNQQACDKGSLIACFLNKCIPLKALLINSIPWKLRQWSIKNLTSTIICQSKKLASVMNNLGYKNIVQIYNFTDIPMSIFQPRKIYDLLFIGRLTENKGVLNLILAVKKVSNTYPDINLFIIGDGPEKENLERLVQKQNLRNNVTFTGVIKNENLTSYYKRSKIFVLPSVGSENNPLTIIEAMANGLPIIASRVGGIPEIIIDGINGFLYPPGNIDKMAKIVNLLLTNRELREKMSKENTDTFLRNFTPENHYEKLIKVYEKVISNN